ncbi:glutamate 5-kinase [Seiridium cupressi]
MKAFKPLTVVIKLGTSSIVDEKTHEPLLPILSLIVATAVKLRKDGHRVVIVSSGAIGVGLQRMNVEKRPKHLAQLQALAAIGQCRLISLWDQLFGYYNQPVAQILLTRNDIADRQRYLNAQTTVNELLDMGVIPIVNENDTLAVAEIKFGDNDTLSAITAAMAHADYLFLMTDVDCLYDKNPRTNPDAQPIQVIEDIDSIRADVSSAGSSLGTGGMGTKIVAAKLATSAGVTTVITRSSKPDNIHRIVRYVQATKALGTPEDHTEDPLSRSTASLALDVEEPPLHTRFLPLAHPIRDRYFWLSHGLAPHGTIYIDAGAYRALADKAGLLPIGVLDVEGSFGQHEAVRLVVVERRSQPGPDGKMWEGTPTEVGRALVNYAMPEIARIKGVRSSKIESLLGYADSQYVADRGNISLFRHESRPVTPTPENLASLAAYEQGAPA